MMREGGVNGIAKSDVGEEELGELREEYKVSLEKTKLELEEEKHQRQRKQVKRSRFLSNEICLNQPVPFLSRSKTS